MDAVQANVVLGGDTVPFLDEKGCGAVLFDQIDQTIKLREVIRLLPFLSIPVSPVSAFGAASTPQLPSVDIHFLTSQIEPASEIMVQEMLRQGLVQMGKDSQNGLESSGKLGPVDIVRNLLQSILEESLRRSDHLLESFPSVSPQILIQVEALGKLDDI